MPLIGITHNIEMGHRLANQPDSKCFHLHGHSWLVELDIYGPVDLESGMIMEYGEVKAKWRGWLDKYYDHHMLLNPDDPLIERLLGAELHLWGITTMPYPVDPTVENVMAMFQHKAEEMFGSAYKYHIKLREAPNNFGEYGFRTYDLSPSEREANDQRSV
jgi:6-pyruvoyl tetrahydropterin synthase/QueD family protein